MILGIIIGLVIGIAITFVVCRNKFSQEHDYSDLIKKTLEDLYRNSSDNNSKKKHWNKSRKTFKFKW